MPLLDLIKKRRSIYNINNKIPLSKKDVSNLIKNIIRHCPTAFNSQSSRIVILYGKSHKKFWDILKDKLRDIIAPDNFIKTSQKIDSFIAAYATILFFEDEITISGLQEKYPLYKENFNIWAEQSNGMLQFAIWTALAEQNIGASLQHYNPLIDEEVIKTWKLPKSWRLIAQMPIGGITTPAEKKDFISITEQIRIFD